MLLRSRTRVGGACEISSDAFKDFYDFFAGLEPDCGAPGGEFFACLGVLDVSWFGFS